MLENMPNQMVTLATVNHWNQEFWLDQSELLNRRIQDAALREIAMAVLSDQQAMMVPVRNRISLEKALSDAEKSRIIFQRAFSRKGGRATKRDGLQGVILEIVRANPDINTRRVLHKICKMAKHGHSLVLRVDQRSDLLDDQPEQIHFLDKGIEKTSPVSGLKDRLSRAKKEILSR
jgi:hypothetical protein